MVLLSVLVCFLFLGSAVVAEEGSNSNDSPLVNAMVKTNAEAKVGISNEGKEMNDKTTKALVVTKVKIKAVNAEHVAAVKDDFRKLNQAVLARRKLAADSPLRVLAENQAEFESARDAYKNAKSDSEKTTLRVKLLSHASVRIKAYRAQLQNLVDRAEADGKDVSVLRARLASIAETETTNTKEVSDRAKKLEGVAREVKHAERRRLLENATDKTNHILEKIHALDAKFTRIITTLKDAGKTDAAARLETFWNDNQALLARIEAHHDAADALEASLMEEDTWARVAEQRVINKLLQAKFVHLRHMRAYAERVAKGETVSAAEEPSVDVDAVEAQAVTETSADVQILADAETVAAASAGVHMDTSATTETTADPTAATGGDAE